MLKDDQMCKASSSKSLSYGFWCDSDHPNIYHTIRILHKSHIFIAHLWNSPHPPENFLDPPQVSIIITIIPHYEGLQLLPCNRESRG